MNENEKKVSTLPKTWILDLDGTIVIHNGYLLEGKDTLLPGAKEWLMQVKEDDMVIFLTSRKKEYGKMTEEFLKENQIGYDYIIYDAPYGERILVNDRKPSGLPMSYGINTNRNEMCQVTFEEDETL